MGQTRRTWTNIAWRDNFLLVFSHDGQMAQCEVTSATTIGKKYNKFKNLTIKINESTSHKNIL